MTTLEDVKKHLRLEADAYMPFNRRPLTDEEYGNGFAIIRNGSGALIYENFIVPQLSRVTSYLLKFQTSLTCLEVGPGPRSVLGALPLDVRRSITKFDVFEPNVLFALELQEWLEPTTGIDPPFPSLCDKSTIHVERFGIDSRPSIANSTPQYNLILFCQSLYGLSPKHEVVRQALSMATKAGIVVVVHRGTSLDLGSLVCHDNVFDTTGQVQVEESDEALDRFSAFVAGFKPSEVDTDKSIRPKWRAVCREYGKHEMSKPTRISFSCPTMMVTFNHGATALTELIDKVPIAEPGRRIKNSEARLNHPAAILRPKDHVQVQECVRWALKNKVGLSVMSGSHSGHCQWSNVVAIDMEAFDQIHIIKNQRSDIESLVVAGTGCKGGDIVKRAMAERLSIPLGSRPSVGAGLWLQGGIGHLGRQYGLTCDSIIGVVLVGVESGQIFYIGNVPAQYRPAGATRPEFELDLLWAIKGAGTNFGIVTHVIFKAVPALVHSVQHYELRLSTSDEVCLELGNFHRLLASKAPREESVDAYLYTYKGQQILAWSVIKTSTTKLRFAGLVPMKESTTAHHSSIVDDNGLFDEEYHISSMPGDHGSGKTSSFKRCVFLKSIETAEVRENLSRATSSAPSESCYVHLLHGGGAMADVLESSTAFGCRDWEYACVITGVWKRDKDGTPISRRTVGWVYDTVNSFLPLCSGIYGADLGPDPRDLPLAAKAFGSNRPRLARLKDTLDPYNVLAYACPLPPITQGQKLIVLVSGDTCAGKDYCAKIWADSINACMPKANYAQVISISNQAKKDYAAATPGCDLDQLLYDRAYKEEHRAALTLFWQHQMALNPQLPEEHFLDTVAGAAAADVLFITGIRDDAPVATLSYLVPACRVVEVRVTSSRNVREVRSNGRDKLESMALKHRPCLNFENNANGPELAKGFATRYLFPYLHEDLRSLAELVNKVRNFPTPGTDFCHILGIVQRPGGLSLCTSLLQAHFHGSWSDIDAIVSCEAGGFIFASALAIQVKKPLILIRRAGKLPRPTVSVLKPQSYISIVGQTAKEPERLEMDRDALPRGASVAIVDDVLSTGRTMCAVLELLEQTGVSAEKIRILTVAEFPVHRGRQLIQRGGYGRSLVQSLLVFGNK
ncbi:hypothetical protein EJ05DRAFT_457152 [Pseudovirgaria hyperparasitica]|uniref:FAD-binding PCMH-type domain-containing protein n=1 Tax=Pseudovirgaria hyperparasitica TaxID=470096 RepID=A0A6A6VVT1_9PEZI|nr:uncharacterized protein EJ05DRAFT_457152 [Pseudovirgaria hyperparasitica]KAF2754343.1 hypothetical protein EJ05DRAFT_457152 [Pseudovirgaria hyperparasitica]